LTIPRLGVDLQFNQFTLSTTYGVTDDLDVNLTVPVIYADLENRRDFRFGAVFQGGFRQGISDTLTDTSVDVADLFLRAKYRFVRAEWLHAAGGLTLRIPTAEERQPFGTVT